jgi:hypothetical protein
MVARRKFVPTSAKVAKPTCRHDNLSLPCVCPCIPTPTNATPGSRAAAQGHASRGIRLGQHQRP